MVTMTSASRPISSATTKVMRITSAFFNVLSLKAPRNWVRNSGRKRRDASNPNWFGAFGWVARPVSLLLATAQSLSCESIENTLCYTRSLLGCALWRRQGQDLFAATDEGR
jgi:hypothetical protein